MDPWPGFRYTGSVRACYPLSPPRSLPLNIERPDYAQDGEPKSERDIKLSSLIRQLSLNEQSKMRIVCRMAREVLTEASGIIRAGVTTDEIDAVVHAGCLKRNAYPSPLNYRKFPKSCCTSVNEVICHGIPDRRPLERGDLVNVDVTLFYDGMHGDVNETFIVGGSEACDEAGRLLVESARECLEEAIKACKPGFKFRNLGTVIQRTASRNGHSVVKTYCGHGINQLFHCAPSVPHYAGNKAVGVMKPGQVFTIEPMINEGGWRDVHWLDGWTAVTEDGGRSAQFEHTLLVTDTGVEILT